MLERCAVGDVIEVSIAEAVGAVLAEPVVAAEDVPPFANSAVDGYAVRAGRCRRRRRSSCGWSPRSPRAGRPIASSASGEAIRIMTGAPMPAGADASVMVEDTERSTADEVVIRRSVHRGRVGARRRRRRARRHRAVRSRAPSSRRRWPACWPASTPGGCACYRKPRVAVLSTGDELINDGSALRPGQIRESNKTMLLPLVAEAGCEAVDLGVVRDDEAALEALLARRRASLRRDRHQRRRQHGRVRRGEGGAVADRRHALDADRHQARQAVRVRAARRPGTAARRCSACRATRSARWSASSCSPARRCAR